MEKTYSGRYPERRQEQHRDINKALVDKSFGSNYKLCSSNNDIYFIKKRLNFYNIKRTPFMELFFSSLGISSQWLQ